MKPQIKNKRQQYPGGKYVQTFDLNDWTLEGDDIFEPMDFNDIDTEEYFDDVTSESVKVNPEMTASDEERRVEALKRAIDIAKLMSNVTIEGIIAIGEQVDKYLKEN